MGALTFYLKIQQLGVCERKSLPIFPLGPISLYTFKYFYFSVRPYSNDNIPQKSYRKRP